MFARTSHRPPLGVGLRLYVALLVILLLHGVGLTIATLIVSADPSLVDMAEFVPAGHVAFYVASNLLLAACIVVLIVSVQRRRRVAIVHNFVYCVLSIVLLVAWHLIGMKSGLGTLIDSVPGLVGIVYFASSGHVRETLRTGGRQPSIADVDP